MRKGSHLFFSLISFGIIFTMALTSCGAKKNTTIYPDPYPEEEIRLLRKIAGSKEFGQMIGWWARNKNERRYSLSISFREFFDSLSFADMVIISVENGNGFLCGNIGNNDAVFTSYLKYGVNNSFKQYYEIKKTDVKDSICWDIPEDPDHPCYIDIIYLKDEKVVGYSVLRGISDHTVIHFDIFHEALFTDSDLTYEQGKINALLKHEGYMEGGEPMKEPSISAPKSTERKSFYINLLSPAKEQQTKILITDSKGFFSRMIGRWNHFSAGIYSMPLDILDEYFKLTGSDMIEVSIQESDAVLSKVSMGSGTSDNGHLRYNYILNGIKDDLYWSMELTAPQTVYWDVAYERDEEIEPSHPYYIDILYYQNGKITAYSVLKSELGKSDIFFNVLHEAFFTDGPVSRRQAMVNILQEHK